MRRSCISPLPGLTTVTCNRFFPKTQRLPNHFEGIVMLWRQLRIRVASPISSLARCQRSHMVYGSNLPGRPLFFHRFPCLLDNRSLNDAGQILFVRIPLLPPKSAYVHQALDARGIVTSQAGELSSKSGIRGGTTHTVAEPQIRKARAVAPIAFSIRASSSLRYLPIAAGSVADSLASWRRSVGRQATASRLAWPIQVSRILTRGGVRRSAPPAPARGEG